MHLENVAYLFRSHSGHNQWTTRPGLDQNFLQFQLSKRFPHRKPCDWANRSMRDVTTFPSKWNSEKEKKLSRVCWKISWRIILASRKKRIISKAVRKHGCFETSRSFSGGCVRILIDSFYKDQERVIHIFDHFHPSVNLKYFRVPVRFEHSFFI